MTREQDVSKLYKHFSEDIKKDLDFAIGIFSATTSSGRLTIYDEVIKKETHYLLERRGHKWDKENKMFIGVDDNKYNNAREVVEQGFLMFLLMNYMEFKRR